MRPGINFIGVSVSFFCHDDKGNFLLHKRSDKCRDEIGRWDFGGGQLEFGESLEKAVLREVKEEYGAKGEIERQLTPYSLIRNEKKTKTHWLIVPHIIRVNRKKVINNDPKKIVELGWFKLSDLPQPLHTGAIYTLYNYKSYFKKYGS